MTEFIHKIPHVIDRCGLTAQGFCVLVPNSDFESFGERRIFIHASIISQSLEPATQALDGAALSFPARWARLAAHFGQPNGEASFRQVNRNGFVLRVFSANLDQAIRECADINSA
jgi:hypothetical protein